MDTLQNIRLATIPWPLRVVFALFGALILLLNGYILYIGFSRDNYDIWIASGRYLLGVVLPVVVVMLTLQFSHSGVRALRDRTADVLTKLLPQQLRLTSDCSEEIASVFSGRRRLHRSKTSVRTMFLRGECWADYALRIPQRTTSTQLFRCIRLRIEVNVHRANVDVFLPKTLIESELAGTVQNLFPHTLGGATGAGYMVNDRTVDRTADGRDFACLVLVRELKPDFLWNAAEKLWFAQDLMFMVRSFVQERPEFFVDGAGS